MKAILKFNGSYLKAGGGVLTKQIGTGTAVIGGKEYPTVVIGNQEWLAENLDYAFEETNPESYYTYYDNSDTYKDRGLLYNHYAAMDLHQNRATLCPGWHLPTVAEFEALIAYIGADAGKKLKSTTGWSNDGNGTDNYGFNGKPAGLYAYGGVGYTALDIQAWYWTQNSYSNVERYTRVLTSSNDSFVSGLADKLSRCSIRLIKDSA
ncbi:MAG: hypothetical protein J6T78_04105 [Bacteroidaceae bacterium]|nr:hypothetical protein [Bacteroidaceae bacterium]